VLVDLPAFRLQELQAALGDALEDEELVGQGSSPSA
jgi:hypothetical protein